MEKNKEKNISKKIIFKRKGQVLAPALEYIGIIFPTKPSGRARHNQFWRSIFFPVISCSPPLQFRGVSFKVRAGQWTIDEIAEPRLHLPIDKFKKCVLMGEGSRASLCFYNPEEQDSIKFLLSLLRNSKIYNKGSEAYIEGQLWGSHMILQVPEDIYQAPKEFSCLAEDIELWERMQEERIEKERKIWSEIELVHEYNDLLGRFLMHLLSGEPLEVWWFAEDEIGFNYKGQDILFWPDNESFVTEERRKLNKFLQVMNKWLWKKNRKKVSYYRSEKLFELRFFSPHWLGGFKKVSQKKI